MTSLVLDTRAVELLTVRATCRVRSTGQMAVRPPSAATTAPVI